MSNIHAHAHEADLIGRPVAKRGGDYEFDGEIRAVIVKRSGAVRYAVEDDRGLLLVMNARQCGLLTDINPAEALREIGEGMVDGDLIKGVDHASFDRAARHLAEPCELTEADRWRITFRDEGRKARRDGLTIADCPAFPHVPNDKPHPFAGVDHGTEWIAGWREEDEGGDRSVAACRSKFEGRPFEGAPQSAPWRTEGVADLGAFRITTGDPRFDPGEPVTVNGFLYVPAKEKEHG